MQKQNEILTCPELFEGMEQFLEEQLARLKRAGLLTASVIVPCSIGFLYFIKQAA